MARDQKVKVRIQAKDEASATVQKTQTSLQRLGNFVKTNLAASMISVTAVVYGFVRALTAAIKASAEQELAVRKLDAALSPLGDKAGAVSKELQEYAAALQQVTAYGDETIIAGQALIASFTKNTDEIKGATQAALDLASATGQSLQSAFLLLGRAAAGETSMLSRYGITLDENVPKAEKFAAALKKINEQFGGQAVAQAQTFSGQMAQLGNAFGDLQEAIGDSITQNAKATASLGSLRAGIEGLIPLARRMGDVFSAVGETIWTLALPLRAVAEATKWVTDAWLKLSGATDIVEGSAKGLETTAKRLGITVDELRVRLVQARIATRDLNEDATKLAPTFAADAAEINALVGGLQKMEDVAETAAPAVEEVGEAASDAGGAFSSMSDELGSVRSELEATGRAAVATAAQIDAVTASARRVQLPGGGSRLTSSPTDPLFPGLSGSGGTFTTYRKGYVRPDGTVVYL